MKRNKCPKCKSKETIETSYLGECHGYFIAEKIIKCKNCGNIKYHWTYGMLVVDNWKDLSTPPFLYRIKEFFKRLFLKHKDNELPF